MSFDYPIQPHHDTVIDGMDYKHDKKGKSQKKLMREEMPIIKWLAIVLRETVSKF